MTHALDILLLGLPRLNIDVPPMGIASIKASVEAHGFRARCRDLNIHLYHTLTFSEWLEIDDYFQTDLRYVGGSARGAGTRHVEFRRILANREGALSCREKYRAFLEREIDEALAANADWIGVSVFSVNSVVCTLDFLSRLKARAPRQKVLAGGMGLSSFGLGGEANFASYLKAEGLIDAFIAGEGEHAVIDVLGGGKIDGFTPQIDRLDELPFPDYRDFDFSLYPGKENMLYITGSRGCVRRCTFCDIGALWKKFRYRSGASLAAEMELGYQRHGTTDFYFTDSLINGNLREFDVLLDEVIARKRDGRLPRHITFGGQWICRPAERFGADRYKKMGEAGVYNLSVGVESGSNAVLADMRKGTSREDHDFMMEQLQLNGIRINLLLLLGYPTEREEDFEATLQMLRDYKKYSDSGIIWGVVLGKTMVVLPNTPIGDQPEKWGITYDDEGNWVSRDNPGLTYHERVRRRLIAGRLCEELGYVIKSQVVTVNSLYEIVKRGGYDSIA